MEAFEEDPYRDVAIARLADLLERSRYGDDLPSLLWTTAMVMLEQATARTREWHWWRSNPRGELRQLRGQVAEAMALARLAADLQDGHNDAERASTELARREAAEFTRARRRAQTLPAELARLAAAAARTERSRGEGVPRRNFHLAPDYPLEGVDRPPAKPARGGGRAGSVPPAAGRVRRAK